MTIAECGGTGGWQKFYSSHNPGVDQHPAGLGRRVALHGLQDLLSASVRELDTVSSTTSADGPTF